jgi:hypothetical protein
VAASRVNITISRIMIGLLSVNEIFKLPYPWYSEFLVFTLIPGSAPCLPQSKTLGFSPCLATRSCTLFGAQDQVSGILSAEIHECTVFPATNKESLSWLRCAALELPIVEGEIVWIY